MSALRTGVRRCPRRQGRSVFSRNSGELLLKTPAPAESSLNDIGCTGSAKRCASVKRLGSQRTCLYDGERSNLSVTAVLTIWWLLEGADCSIPMRSAIRLFEKFLEGALSYAEIRCGVITSNCFAQNPCNPPESFALFTQQSLPSVQWPILGSSVASVCTAELVSTGR